MTLNTIFGTFRRTALSTSDTSQSGTCMFQIAAEQAFHERTQARADEQRCRRKVTRLGSDLVLAHVEARLQAKDSPMTISVELARGVHPGLGGATVSHETIYAEVQTQGRRTLPKVLHSGLQRGRRCRKRRALPGQEATGRSDCSTRPTTGQRKPTGTTWSAISKET